MDCAPLIGRGELIFAATGVTQGSILRGIERAP